jgi:hypothetical protein
VWLEGLGELKKYSYLIGTRTRDILASSIVPQPTMLSRATPEVFVLKSKCVQYHQLVSGLTAV